MKPQKQLMRKTKMELSKMLVQLGVNISAWDLKHRNKESLVQVIINAENI